MALPSSGGTGGPEVWRSSDGGLYARLPDGRVVNLATGQFQTYIPPMSQRITTSLSTQSISNQYPYAWQYVPGVPMPSATATPTPTPTSTPYVNTGALGQSYPQVATAPKPTATLPPHPPTTTTPTVYGPPAPWGYKPGPSATPSAPAGQGFPPLRYEGQQYTTNVPGGSVTYIALRDALGNLTWTVQSQYQTPTGGQGFAPTPYAQTERGVAEQRAFEAEQARLAREAAAAEAERNRLEQLRQSRFSALQGIVDRFIAEQGNASRLVAGLGPDQFKMAAALQGLPVLGTTPQAGFARAQTEFASRPVPNVSAEAPISDIESAIAAIGGIKPPSLPTSGFGMAMGGTLPGMVPEMMPPQPMPEQPPGMMPGQEMMTGGIPPMGPPAAPGAPQFGTTKTAVLIGEGNLQVEPGTEVAITDTATGTTEIIPLTGQAATGASIFSPGYGGFATRAPGSVFDPMSGVAAINPLYAGMGFSQFPMANQNQSMATLSRLGAQPSLIRETGTPGVYWRNPVTNVYQGIPRSDWFEQSGFNWNDVVDVGKGEIFGGRGLPMGSNVTAPPPLAPPGTGSESFSQKLGQPLVEPMTGAILPAPRANAFKLAQLAARDASLFELALQAYESAGLTRQAVLSSLTNVLITGRDQGTGIGLR